MHHEHNQAPPQEFIDRINQALDISWKSAGGISINLKACGDHWHIMICPAIREVLGGKDDGARLFTRYSLNITKFLTVFDKGTKKKVEFDSDKFGFPCFYAKGEVAGHQVDFSFLGDPPAGQQPAEIIHAVGPKKDQIEMIPDRMPPLDEDNN
jgi:hypothetical protein